MVELKKGWSKFRICEEEKGVFTGHITTDPTKIFTNDDRELLLTYTRQYLKEKLGYTITDQWGKILE